jgi:hypothetical protein
MTRRMALQMGSATVTTKRRRSGPPVDPPPMQHSDWLVRRRFSTRSLPSLVLLQEALTGLQQTNALYLSGDSAPMAASLRGL